MRLSTDIFYNVLNQTVVFRVLRGRPTSATFSVFHDFDDDTAVAQFSGACTVDTVNTTLSDVAGAAQADPQRIPLTSVVGIVTGRKYLLSENNIQLWVDVVEVGATYVRVRHPLKKDFTAAATFVSAYIFVAISAAFVTDLTKLSDLSDPNPDYRIRLDIVVGGVTYPEYAFFDLIRAKYTPHVDITDLTNRQFGLADNLPVAYRDDEGRSLVDQAWKACRADLLNVNINPDSLRDDESADELVLRKALVLLAEAGWFPPNTNWESYTKMRRETYGDYLQQHFTVALKHELALETGGGATNQQKVPPLDLWVK